jgi:hypothetical protein
VLHSNQDTPTPKLVQGVVAIQSAEVLIFSAAFAVTEAVSLYHLQLLTACADYLQNCNMQHRYRFVGKRAAAVTDSSGNAATTTNAADDENASSNREADWSAVLLGLVFSLSAPAAAILVIATLPLLSVTAAGPLSANSCAITGMHLHWLQWLVMKIAGPDKA